MSLQVWELGEARRLGDLLDGALAVDLGEHHPFARVQRDLLAGVGLVRQEEDRDHADVGDALREHAPLVLATRGLEEQVRAALANRPFRRGLVGLEGELAVVPAHEREEGFLAHGRPGLGVEDGPGFEIDRALLGIRSGHAQPAGLHRAAEELNDVRGG